MWSAVEPVTKNFVGIATSNVEETIIAKCHSCRPIKAGGLRLDKDARGALPKIMSQNRILPAASNEKITTLWTEQQMDRPIELIGLLTKVSQMPTCPSFVNSYAIGSTIRDKHLVIWRKNHCSNFQQTVRCKLRRWNKSSWREIRFFQMQALRKRHRRPWFAFFAPGPVVSRNETRVLTRNVEVALRIKCQVKRMIDARIYLSVSLYEDLSEVVLSILIEGAVEL